MATAQPLWRPSNPEKGPISIYRNHINKKFDLDLRNSQDLHKWSVSSHRHEFWIDLWSYVGMTPSLPTFIKQVYDPSQKISQNPEWFQGVQMNYAENVLEGRNLDGIALIGLREGERFENADRWTWRDLRENVRRARNAFLRLGVRKGDRVAVLMSNCNWCIALFLAAASAGIVFSSISPDMGLEGVVSRLQQVEPKILIADSSQTYKAKQVPMVEKILKVIDALSEKPPTVFVVPLGATNNIRAHGLLKFEEDFLARASPDDALEYERVPFSQSLVILYSSGTTGPPKCIVHQHGIILQLKKISLLHNSLTEADVVLQYSSTSWVLWNIMNGHLSVGATTICYDGSPLYPTPATKLEIIQHFRATYFGTSPRWLLELSKFVYKPSSFDLSSLRMVTTTGATLTPDQFHYFYSFFPKSVHLSSVAGGTEICTSWLASDPAGPVYAGEMQMPALGMDVDVANTETGESIKWSGEAGELVCRTPFPSMPTYFWGDVDGKKYREAYFDRFEGLGIWAQHDWIQFNPKTGGAQIHGRSDGTLNPSGIRFGSAEIYSIVETSQFPQILDTLCVGRKRPHDRDEEVFLFVKMTTGHIFTNALQIELRTAIRTNLSPRHVPRFIVPIEEIPVTINGKKVEIAVKKILSGDVVKVSSTVMNPESLVEYGRYVNLEYRRDSKL